jgi:hypothetical protein
MYSAKRSSKVFTGAATHARGCHSEGHADMGGSPARRAPSAAGGGQRRWPPRFAHRRQRPSARSPAPPPGRAPARSAQAHAQRYGDGSRRQRWRHHIRPRDRRAATGPHMTEVIMSDLDLGALPVAFDVRDAANALTNATGVTLTITPRRDSATPTVTNPRRRAGTGSPTPHRGLPAAVTTVPNAYGDTRSTSASRLPISPPLKHT